MENPRRPVASRSSCSSARALHTIVIPAVMVDRADRGTLEIDTWRSGQALSISITVDDPVRSAGDAALEVTRARLTRATLTG